MKKLTTEKLVFQGINSKKIHASFDGGTITSDAGVMWLREVDRQISLTDALANAICDKRDQRYVKQEMHTMIAQRIYQISCGYEDANNCDDLRVDPAFKMAVNRLPIEGDDLASQPTISRLENAVTRSDLYRISEVLVDQFIDSYAKPPEIIVLDFDHTDNETHGHQQLTLFNGYYDEYCYLPLHVYEGLSGKLITTILRPGKRPDGKENTAIAKRIVRKIQKAWPSTHLLFRGDSHFAQPELFDCLEDNHATYVTGMTGNAVLQRLAEPLVAKVRRLSEKTDRAGICCFSSVRYQAGTWRSKRRVVIKAEMTPLGMNVRFVVTNLGTASNEGVYKIIYCGRGNMENFIKDHKVYLKSDRSSCSNFLANQFRLFLHSAAYILLQSLRQNLLRGSELAYARVNTIREKLLKIGARVIERKTMIRIHLPTSFPLKPLALKMDAVLRVLAAP